MHARRAVKVFAFELHHKGCNLQDNGMHTGTCYCSNPLYLQPAHVRTAAASAAARPAHSEVFSGPRV